jgi:hypothetical protein
MAKGRRGGRGQGVSVREERDRNEREERRSEDIPLLWD